ncbi:MAG: hypothetical protein PHC48_10385 [Prevotella sp.]|nr:hypothetical protein [Prevotella sp.]
MELIINKTDFEQALPVGASSHEEVFEKIQPTIDEVKAYYEEKLLGDAGRKIIADALEENTLIKFLKRLISFTAFLQVFRQLDLVLTPTGFGIVSNDQVSPASKQRVDALYEQLRTNELRTHAMVVNSLRNAEWGVTEQAVTAIPYLYDEFRFFYDYFKGATYQDWENMQPSIETADELLRVHISDVQMDELLRVVRCNDVDEIKKYSSLISRINRFTEEYSCSGVDALKSEAYRRVIMILESDLDGAFTLYRDSDAYKLNHNVGFTNIKESTGFVFNG